MKQVISTEKRPIKMWLDNIEDGALQQAKNLANLPFTFKHIALMPDCHMGIGMPIGGVIATKNVIIPSAVGVDIGCGMCYIQTNIHIDQLSKTALTRIKNTIKDRIPVGFKRRITPYDKEFLGNTMHETSKISHPVIWNEMQAAQYQLGTLGGGNHFIEIQKDKNGFIGIMIHSGSRNLGKKVADYHIKIAKNLNKQWYSSVPEEYQLPFLPMNSNEAKIYRNEMDFCVEFALKNRKIMMEIIKDIITQEILPVEFDEMINIAHNYAAFENHFNSNVIVHRKGATRARSGEIGIIPGSQGTASYIVEGLGNPESFCSCSHGAGRKMSRTKAKTELNLEEQKKILDDQNIIHDMTTQNSLDEAPGSYKDIDVVMENQKDLVKIIKKLKPVVVVKG
jgi:tRNA-splicing ligase RtcB